MAKLLGLGRQAPMAAIDVVMPAPPLPPPAPVVRIIRRLALAAADAVVCLWIASLWAIHASLALFATAVIGGLIVCGLECTGAALTLVLASLLFVAIVWPLAAMLLIIFVELYTNQLDKGAAIIKAIVKTHLIATTVFAILEAFGFLLKLLAAKDSLAERFASVIMVAPLLGISVMCCLVSIPGLAARVWWMRRHGSASVVPI